MVSSKLIIDNLKKQDLSSLHEDIQSLLQMGKVSYPELVKILRIIMASLTEAEDSSNPESYHLKLMPCINLCVDYVKDNLKTEKLTVEAFIPILYHIVKSYLKSELFSPALSYAENCVHLLSYWKNAESFSTLLSSFSKLLWNEAYSLEKFKKDFSTAYKLRCKALEFNLLGEFSSTVLDKSMTTFGRYLLCKERDANEVTSFMEKIWNDVFWKKEEEPFSLYEMAYLWFKFHVLHFKHPLILKRVLNCLLELVTYLEKNHKKNIFLITCIRIAIASIETFVLKENKSPSKKICDAYKNTLRSCSPDGEKMITQTWGFFRTSFSELHVQLGDFGQDAILAHDSLDFILLLITEYFRIPPNYDPKDETNFYQGDLCFANTLINIFACLLKNEKNSRKIEAYIKYTQDLIVLSTGKFAFTKAPSGMGKNIFVYATSIDNVALILYNSNMFSESIWFVEKSIDLCSNCKELGEDCKKKIWKKRELSIMCHLRSGHIKKALDLLVPLSLEDTSKRKECMKLWHKIKKEALKAENKNVFTRTFSDMLEELNLSICVEEELAFLLEELKCPIQERRACTDELVAVVHKIFGLPLTGAMRAKALLEIVNIFPSVSDKMSSFGNKSVMELCIESINLFKDHLTENPDDNEAKLQLSICYFWLYFLKQSKIHQVSEKEAEVCLAVTEGEKKLENEENEICDIQPIFPLVNYLVEMETINSLELALDIWLEVLTDTNLSNLKAIIIEWDIITALRCTAEIFSTSAKNLSEVKSWILLKNIAQIFENKVVELSASLSLTSTLIELGYLKVAEEMLNKLESRFSEFLSCATVKETEMTILKLKVGLHLTKSNLYFLCGKFDEGLKILRECLGNSILKNSSKSVRILYVEALLLGSKYLSAPVSTYQEIENIQYFKENSAITLALESNNLAKNILRKLAEMENTHSDFMSFKAILLRNTLKGTVQLAELYFSVGDPRYARCFLKEALKLAESHVLTFWTSKILLLLGYVDLLCDSPNDCLVKLNALKYVMNASDKANASEQLSKVYDTHETSSTVEENSEDYLISSTNQTPFVRSVKQDFMISDVMSSPIRNNKKQNFEFEFQLVPSKHCEFSNFLIDLEIMALGCMHLLATNKEPVAEKQLKKLLLSCEKLKKLSSINEVLCSYLGSQSKNCDRAPFLSEMHMETSVLLKLSDIYFVRKDFKNADSYLGKAIENLSKSSKHYKCLYPRLYALLQYYKIVRSLKNFLNIDPQSSLEFSICPSYQYCSISSKSLKAPNTQALMCTPTKVKNPSILVTPCPDSKLKCKAPVKKDIVPFYIKYDMEAPNSLTYSSSDDEVFTSKKDAPPKNLRTAKKPGKQASKTKSESTYKVFKSKNEPEVKSASDVWKLADLASPKVTNEMLPSLQTKRKTRSTRSTKTAVPKSPFKLSLKSQRKPKSKSNSEFYVDAVESVKNASNLKLGPRMSIEETRCTSNVDSPKVERFLNFEDILKDLDSPKVEKGLNFEDISKKYSPIEDLCKNIDGINLNSEKDDKENRPVLPDEMIEKYTTELENIRLLIQHNCPYPLYVNVCKLLGILLMAMGDHAKDESALLKSEFLLSETYASSLRQVYLNTLRYTKGAVESSLKSLSPQSLEPDFSLSTQLEYLINSIPKDYTIVQISALPDKNLNTSKIVSTPKLLISRYQQKSKPLTICIDSSSNQRFNSFVHPEFETIITENTVTMKNSTCDDSKTWWKTRAALDSRLQDLVRKAEDIWLGCWKGLLLSNPVNKQRKQKVSKMADTLTKISKPSNETLLKVFLDSIPFLKQDQISACVCQLWNCSPLDDLHTQLLKTVRELTSNLPETGRHAVVLILDKILQPFPWESFPIMEGIPVSRMPSLSLMSCMSNIQENKLVLKNGCDSNKTFYILNPDKNLEYCQKYFQPKFEKYQNWSGVSGRIPTSDECISAIQDHDLFIYCGHGSGKQYLGRTSVSRLKCRATSILMGCSSGRLQPLGKDLDAFGLPLCYLMQGSPCIVGNLWNVTDKDIDRFADSFFEKFIPNYKEKGNTTNIASAVSEGRKACKMLYLTGAAPVVYGFPITAKNLS